MIGVHRLEGFYWVATTGGYARAARAFPYPISQPGVHQQVKKLEEELGLSLFENAGKDNLLLTSAGKRLFEFIQPFYSALPGVVRSLGADDLRGELRIGAPSMYLHNLLPTWLRRIQEASPDIRVVAEETPWGEVERLIRGDFDLLVDYLPEIPDRLAAVQVASLQPLLVVSSKDPRATRPDLTPQAMKDETFVAYLPGHLRDLQDQGLQQLAIEPPHIVTASTAQAISGFVAAGLGYSLLGGLSSMERFTEGVTVHPIREPEVRYPVWAVWRKDAAPNPMRDIALATAP